MKGIRTLQFAEGRASCQISLSAPSNPIASVGIAKFGWFLSLISWGSELEGPFTPHRRTSLEEKSVVDEGLALPLTAWQRKLLSFRPTMERHTYSPEWTESQPYSLHHQIW